MIYALCNLSPFTSLPINQNFYELGNPTFSTHTDAYGILMNFLVKNNEKLTKNDLKTYDIATL